MKIKANIQVEIEVDLRHKHYSGYEIGDVLSIALEGTKSDINRLYEKDFPKQIKVKSMEYEAILAGKLGA